MSVAGTQCQIVIARQHDKITLTIRGPETKATLADSPGETEFFGINFRLGTFMPHLPASQLVDSEVNLPEATGKSFWLHGAVWEMPTFDNADVFVERLVRKGMLVNDPIVAATLLGQAQEVSVRSVQRRFLRATGLTHGAIFQIERARHAAELLAQGVSILDTVEQAGYADQPHLTRSLKRLVGQTPAQIVHEHLAAGQITSK